MHQARTNGLGRYFDTNLAINPLIVMIIIRSTFNDKAASAQADAKRSGVSTGVGTLFIIA